MSELHVFTKVEKTNKVRIFISYKLRKIHNQVNVSDKQWKNLFMVCLGLFMSTVFCMKWMEADFLVNGEKFTIMGLELFYLKEKVMAVLGSLDSHVKTILNYHLHFDFAFMVGVFPGIAALCMLAREKAKVIPF